METSSKLEGLGVVGLIGRVWNHQWVQLELGSLSHEFGVISVIRGLNWAIIFIRIVRLIVLIRGIGVHRFSRESLWSSMGTAGVGVTITRVWGH